MKSQVILITGASSGIGKVTALSLIKEGYTVYGAARRLAKMEDLKDAGGHIIEMDVTHEGQLQAGVGRIISEQGRIDVLINNAGYGSYGSVEETSIDDARKQFEVNIFGLARLTQLILPYMRRQQSGKIINISSMGGRIYTPLGAWYHATKHALEGWSDCLRLELKPFNIKVIVIQPGAIATEFGDVMLDPMIKRSGDGPYREITRAMVKATEASILKPGAASPPSVIAKVIIQAIASKNPKTRYAAGKMARPLMFFRKYFGDNLFDKAVLSQMR